MIDSNVKGLMYVTKAVLPQWFPEKLTHNQSWLHCKEVYPHGSVYQKYGDAPPRASFGFEFFKHKGECDKPWVGQH